MNIACVEAIPSNTAMHLTRPLLFSEAQRVQEAPDLGGQVMASVIQTGVGSSLCPGFSKWIRLTPEVQYVSSRK